MNHENGSISVDCPADRWVRDTSIFRKWESMKQEIQRHKWCESQKAGYDIGWDRATVDWMIHNGTETSDKK